MTAVFSAGQILGPVFAGYLYDHTGSLAGPSWAAAAALVDAAGLLSFAPAQRRQRLLRRAQAGGIGAGDAARRIGRLAGEEHPLVVRRGEHQPRRPRALGPRAAREGIEPPARRGARRKAVRTSLPNSSASAEGLPPPRAALAAPHYERVLFAGEATDPAGGVAGANASGHRAAKEALAFSSGQTLAGGRPGPAPAAAAPGRAGEAAGVIVEIAGEDRAEDLAGAEHWVTRAMRLRGSPRPRARRSGRARSGP